MKLTSFQAEKVHGYLNFNIEFFPSVTFLIGINGSGKTTVLKLILGLTSPSYIYLSQIDFTRCRVTLANDHGDDYTVIEATKRKDKLYISFFNRHRDLTSQGIKLGNNKNESFYGKIVLNEDFERSEVVSLIRNLSTPKFLGLDRRVHVGSNIDNNDLIKYKDFIRKEHITYYGSSDTKIQEDPINQPHSLDLSLVEVQKFINSYINKVKSNQILLGEEFRQKTFQEVFKYSDNNSATSIASQIEDSSKLNNRKKIVNLAISELGLLYLKDSVNNFFEKMEALLYEYKANASEEDDEIPNVEQLQVLIKWIYNSSKLSQIDGIIEFSQQYQTQVDQLKEPLERLKSIVTNFLKEGSKILQLTEEGILKVMLKNDAVADVKNLSSGEKQIIIMIAHLIFEEDQKPSGIFIIDEPELSLHLAWQEIFVSSIMEASPKTQFILATHSPSIIAKSSMQLFCQDLSYSNNQ